MLVFKFGGASVKNALAVKNVLSIVQRYQNTPLCIVISAMDKTTNALEKVVQLYYQDNITEANETLNSVKLFHESICKDLDIYSQELAEILNNYFIEIEWLFESNLKNNYDYDYDQIVSMGELLSTTIIHTYLNKQGIINTWLDARDFIKTNDRYREGRIIWDKTSNALTSIVDFNNHSVYITQGFIGSTNENNTTTLGREGSDFTAAIIAHILQAEAVYIWKDVTGVLNADPKYFDNTIKLDYISYEEAIELTYYGASVIHPRTIQPLQNKNIPLHVKSFIDPTLPGTIIHSKKEVNFLIPCFIFKVNQCLLSLTPKDFTFIAEDHFKEIFTAFSDLHVKIHVMQHSAITFWACVDWDERKIGLLKNIFSENYDITLQTGLELITIRHYNDSTIDRVTENKKIVLEQRNKETIRLICI